MLLLCAVLALLSFGTSETARAFSNQVIQKGAVGDDVIELQARLQYIGYYKGTIDGVFGYSTYWALRNFQKAYGMPVDGLAGPGVKAKLVKASKYDAAYVKSMVASGKKFTYYGGTKKQAPKTAAKKIRPNRNQCAKRLFAKRYPPFVASGLRGGARRTV